MPSDIRANSDARVERAIPANAALPALIPLKSVFRAVVTTIVPESSALEEKSWSELEGVVEDTLADRPAIIRSQLRIFIRAIEWLPLFRYGKRFTSLPARDRTRFLTWLQDNRLSAVRVGFWGLRTLALLGYYSRPEAARAIGYAADCRGWEASA